MRPPLLALALLLVAVAPASAGIRAFRTPSGNIGCVISLAGGPATVRCDISRHSWRSPRRPRSCPLSYGDSLELTATGPTRWVCHGDTTLHQGRILGYDSSITFGPFVCISRFTGLTCSNHAHHSFFLSRQEVRLG